MSPVSLPRRNRKQNGWLTFEHLSRTDPFGECEDANADVSPVSSINDKKSAD